MVVGIHVYCMLAPILYQLSTFDELFNNGSDLALGSAVLWDDVTGETDGSQKKL